MIFFFTIFSTVFFSVGDISEICRVSYEKFRYFQSNTESADRCVGLTCLLVHVCCIINLKLFLLKISGGPEIGQAF